MSEYRPNPDAILKQVTDEQRRSHQGRLKVFFGMCPGVGKTYAMLKAAHERRVAGVNVCIGVVETHGRLETQNLLTDFEILPQKKLEIAQTALTEFDLDLALSLKPELILIDELAHNNAPGSRHPKRYQDVQELLSAGIDVYTTVNVQHVESRSDLVFQMAGVPVREKVPDRFFEGAHEIELIDITPEKLLGRLQDGKIYLEERAEMAAQNFFKEETIIGLRELALRFTAELVDEKLKGQMTLKGIEGPWNTNERLLVAVSQSPLSRRLIRTTRRMAFNLEAPWVALYVDTGNPLSETDQKNLKQNLDTARELGAEVITRKDYSIPSALRHVAREKNVTQIIMGRPDRRPLQDFFTGGTILDKLVNETSGVDIHVIRQKQAPKMVGLHFRLPKSLSPVSAYLKTLIFMMAISIFNYFSLPYLGYRALGFVFLLSILPIALFTGLGPTVCAAALSALVWDFIFIPPQFTFAIHESQDVMMILAYFSVAVVAGFLAHRLRRQEAALIDREYRAGILYEFERNLVNVSTVQGIAGHAYESIQNIFQMSSSVFLRNAKGNLADKTVNGLTLPFDERDRAVAHWAFENRKKAGKGTDTLPYATCLCYPLVGRTQTVGVLVVYPNRVLALNEENLLETIATNLSAALEREHLEAATRRMTALEQSEKMHQTLLNSVSHELRTPLTSIIGIASAFHDESDVIDKHYRAELVKNLSESSERLKDTIDNILDMTRVSTGVFQIEKNFFELHDYLRSFISRAKHNYPGHSIVFAAGGEDIYVRGDEKLLDSVFNNLISNSAKYSLVGKPIEVKLRAHSGFAEIKVLDSGTGIPTDSLLRIFDRFFRATQEANGLGLGLCIVKAIVEAHDGIITASNRSGQTGAEFTVNLPLQVLAPEGGTRGE